jgi:hypothetical protein
MRRNVFSIVVSTALLFGSFTVPLPGPAHAGPGYPGPVGADRGYIGQALDERYLLSRVDGGNPSLQGRGSVLVLQADAVPAKALRFVWVSPKFPRFHVRDYTRVAVAQDGSSRPAREISLCLRARA